MATSTNDDKGVTATSSGASGLFTSVEITTGALTLDDPVEGVIYERGRDSAVGEWVSVPYAAGNFTAGSGRVWTVGSGDVVTYAYSLIGLTLRITFWLQNTSVSASAAWLGMALPAGYTAALTTAAVLGYSDGGNPAETGHAEIVNHGAIVYFYKAGAVSWIGATDATTLIGQMEIPIHGPNDTTGSPELPGGNQPI